MSLPPYATIPTWNRRAPAYPESPTAPARCRGDDSRFSDIPQAIANTVALSERLEFELDDLGYEFPRYPVPEGETMDSFLRQRMAEGVMQALRLQT